jgi:peptidoglycan/xylan/chitin deacetylase (PgdA/CDA1 family)
VFWVSVVDSLGERALMAERPSILAYHAVSSTWRSSLAVPEAILAEQLRALRDRGYVGMTFTEAERRRAAGTLPPRTVVVTFDDGYASTLRAQPILEDVGFPATVFVVTGFLDDDAPLSWPGIDTWEGGADEARRRRVGDRLAHGDASSAPTPARRGARI